MELVVGFCILANTVSMACEHFDGESLVCAQENS